MKKSLPNIFSISRAVIAPIVFFLLISGKPLAIGSACVLFFAEAVTDFLDGWWARRYNAQSEWGSFFDPLADKFLTTAAFLGFVIMDIVPLWMVIVIFLRDLTATFMRIIGDKLNKKFTTSYIAKFKTLLQMVFIMFILILLFLSNYVQEPIFTSNINLIIYSDYVYISMLFLTILSIWTVIEYFYKIFR